MKLNDKYPPRIFKCGLEEALKQKLGAEYSVEACAQWLRVTPLTMTRILAGCTVKLENALALAQWVGQPVEELWRFK